MPFNEMPLSKGTVIRVALHHSNVLEVSPIHASVSNLIRSWIYQGRLEWTHVICHGVLLGVNECLLLSLQAKPQDTM